MKDRGFSHDTLMGLQVSGDKNAVANVAQAAGKLLAAPDGPRVAVVEAGGWDTHAGQMQRLVAPLKQLDVGLTALQQSMGPSWKDTAVLILTEFGRTARMNGTNGTDHGTAGLAFIAGGAVAGGHVAGTWPGLKDSQLFENRDLAPTGDLRSLAVALLVNHLGVPASAMRTVFPGSNGITAQGGILRA